MNLTGKNLTEAKETGGDLLEQLGLSAYLFEVEPHENFWEVRVECALDSGWQSSVLNVDDNALRACRTDRHFRDQMLNEWRKRLTALGSG
ncbi:MAG: hypothetical protein AAB134_06530 [Pseudomonadota bacterium]